MARVTLQQIAEIVQCSRSTVSYALKNHPTISQCKREHIQKVAESLGWRPDAALRHQMALIRSTNKRLDLPNLGVVFNKRHDELPVHITIQRHLRGIKERANQLGFSVDIFSLPEQPMTAKRLATVMHSRGIRGLILVDFDLSMPIDYWTLSSEFASVSVGVDPDHTEINVSMVDFLSMGRTAVKSLMERGFSRPGFVLPHVLDEVVERGFTGGIHTGLTYLSETHRLPIFYSSSSDVAFSRDDYASIQNWVRRHQPDVVLSTDSLHLRDCLDLDDNLGQLPVYSLDWRPNWGSRGGINQRSEAVGMAAVDVVVAQLDRGESGSPAIKKTVVIESDWVDESI